MSFNVISLFSGGGGLDIGFEAHDFHPVWCVDIDPESCKTLRHNKPHWNVFEGDIRDFSYDKKVDGVIGGPPCQGFSNAGKGDPDDPRNYLWREYFRVVEETCPDFILLENVPGMLSKKNIHHFHELEAEFKSHGYLLNHAILNSADFGVPQERKRLILLGGKGFKIEIPSPTTTEYRTVIEAIGDLERNPVVHNHSPNNHAPHVVKRWRKLKEGETDPNYRRARLYANKPSTTIRAGGGHGPRGDHLGGFHPPIHYKLPRQLTVREAARLQGFPDSWEFKGSKTAQGRQVGNAVTPPLAEALAGKIREALEAQPNPLQATAI